MTNPERPLGSRDRRSVNPELSAAVAFARDASKYLGEAWLKTEKSVAACEFGQDSEAKRTMEKLSKEILETRDKLAKDLEWLEKRVFG